MVLHYYFVPPDSPEDSAIISKKLFYYTNILFTILNLSKYIETLCVNEITLK